MSEIVGKTIKRLVDLGYDGEALIFTGGTAAYFERGGYDDSAVSVNAETEMSVIHMEALAADQNRDREISAARTRARNELKARIKRNVSPAAWRHWARIHISPMEALTDSLYDQMRYDMNRQVFGGFATVPIASDRGSVTLAARHAAREGGS